MKKLICLFILCWLPCSLFAVENTTAQKACKTLPTFMPYKAGIDALKAKQNTLAFDIFCNLAFQGDYRAQFKMAQFYAGDIPSNLSTNYPFAYAWASLSNRYIQSTNRAAFIAKIFAALSEEQRDIAQNLLHLAAQKVPIGGRIDQLYEPLDLQKIIVKYQEEVGDKAYTGSRIKREDPPLNLQIFN